VAASRKRGPGADTGGGGSGGGPPGRTSGRTNGFAPGFAMVAAATAATPTSERGDDGAGGREAGSKQSKSEKTTAAATAAATAARKWWWVGAEETVLAVVVGEERKVKLGDHNMPWQNFTVTVKIITRAFARRARFHGEGRWDGAGEERKVEVSVEETVQFVRVKCEVEYRCILVTLLKSGMLDGMTGFVDARPVYDSQHDRASYCCKLLDQVW